MYVQETGEHVLVAAGEVHIERCITDLKVSLAFPMIAVKHRRPSDCRLDDADYIIRAMHAFADRTVIAGAVCQGH